MDFLELTLYWYLIGLGLALKWNWIGDGLTGMAARLVPDRGWIGTGLTGTGHGLVLDWIGGLANWEWIDPDCRQIGTQLG